MGGVPSVNGLIPSRMKHILARIEAFANSPVETFENKSIILLISSNIRRKKVNTRVNTIIELLQDREKFIKEIADDFDIDSFRYGSR